MRSKTLSSPPTRPPTRPPTLPLDFATTSRQRTALRAGFAAQTLLVLGTGTLMHRRGWLDVEPLIRGVARERAHGPDEVLRAVVAFGGMTGLLLGVATTLATAAAMAHNPRAARALRPFLLPFARRLSTGAVVVALAGNAAAAPALGATRAASASAAALDPDEPVVRTPFTTPRAADDPVVRVPGTATTAPTSPRSDAPSSTEPTSPPPERPAGGPDSPAPATQLHHEVRPGEHLWGIASAYLHFWSGTPPQREAVASYWARVVAANRDGVRSGDPNLIYAGEIVTIPWPDTLVSPLGRFVGS